MAPQLETLAGLTLCAAGLLLSAAGAAAQQPTAGLRAVVTAAETGEPIAGAIVRVGGGDEKVGRSDADGRVLIGGIAPGSHTVVIAAPAYMDVEAVLDFEAHGIVDIEVTLEIRPIPLDPVDVTVAGRSAKLETVGFYNRLDEGLGTFLTPEAMAERVARASRLSGVFRGVPGLRVSLNTQARRSGTYMLKIPRGGCNPRIWLDGVRLPRDAAEDIDRVAGPREIAAVEVYSGPAQMPSEFNVTGSLCGAVVMWTGPRPDRSR